MDDAWQLVDADGNDEKEQAVDASVLPEVCAEEPVPTMPNPVTVYHPASRLSHAASGMLSAYGLCNSFQGMVCSTKAICLI